MNDSVCVCACVLLLLLLPLPLLIKQRDKRMDHTQKHNELEQTTGNDARGRALSIDTTAA